MLPARLPQGNETLRVPVRSEVLGEGGWVSSGLPWFASGYCWKSSLKGCVSTECLLWGCSARTGTGKNTDPWLLRADLERHFWMNSSQQDIGTRFPEVAAGRQESSLCLPLFTCIVCI